MNQEQINNDTQNNTQNNDNTSNPSSYEKSPEFKDVDFDRLESSFKNGCLVMVPESEIIKFTMPKYMNMILSKYDEKSDVEPFVEATLAEVQEDFKDYEDCFNDINEFCQKIYGCYIEGENVMSTINYNAEWSYCKVIHTYDLKGLEKADLPTKIKCVVDLDGKIYKRKHDETDDDWNARKKELLDNSNKDDNLFLAYVEYF